MKKKINTLIIPFICFEIVGVITDIICHGITINIKGYIYNTLTQNWNNGAVGFLIHTFIAQLTFFFIHKYIINKKVQLIIITIIALLAFLLPSSVHSILRLSYIYMLFLAEGYYLFSKFKCNINIIVFCLAVTLGISVFGVYVSECFGNVYNSLIYLIGVNTGSYCVINISK